MYFSLDIIGRAVIRKTIAIINHLTTFKVALWSWGISRLPPAIHCRIFWSSPSCGSWSCRIVFMIRQNNLLDVTLLMDDKQGSYNWSRLPDICRVRVCYHYFSIALQLGRWYYWVLQFSTIVYLALEKDLLWGMWIVLNDFEWPD